MVIPTSSEFHDLSFCVSRHLPLEWNGSSSSNLFISRCNSETNLTGHRCPTDYWLLELQGFDERCDTANITVFSICVGTKGIALGWEASSMTWQIEAIHVAFLAHAYRYCQHCLLGYLNINHE